MLKQQLMEKLQDQKKLNDLLRIDVQNMELCRSRAAIDPANYDFMPFVFNCVALNSLYLVACKDLLDTAEFREVVMCHCEWILAFIHRRPTTGSKETYDKLQKYINLRRYFLDQVKKSGRSLNELVSRT
jgi:hypothetical protein